MMKDNGDLDLHFWLTRSVGRVMGLNFSKAMENNCLTEQDYVSLVDACRGCPQVSRCQEWLADQTHVSRTAPPGCIIAKPLQKLARVH